jgi:thymidine phosphorylase
MELENMTMTDGYVGQMGKTWKNPTEADLEAAIAGAMEINDMSREEVVAVLESGTALKWRKSPNFYYDHSYGMIGRKRSARPVEPVEACDCGHSVPRSLVVRASLGTACPDCYNRLSD